MKFHEEPLPGWGAAEWAAWGKARADHLNGLKDPHEDWWQFRARHRIPFVERMIPKGGVGAELGVYRGHFTRVLLDVAAPTELYLVDPWFLLTDRWPGEDVGTAGALAGVIRAYAKELHSGQVILRIASDLDFLPTLPDGCLDWVYVDSRHEYEHCRKELELLPAKMAPGGVVCGDDWEVNPFHSHHGVCRAVREFVEADSGWGLVYADDVDVQWAIRRRQ